MRSSVLIFLALLFSFCSAVTLKQDGLNSTSSGNSSALSFQHMSATFGPTSYDLSAPLYIVPEPWASQPYFNWPTDVQEAMRGAVVLTHAASCAPCFAMASNFNQSGVLGLIIADDATTFDHENNECGNRALSIMDFDVSSMTTLPTVGISECSYKQILELAGVEETPANDTNVPSDPVVPSDPMLGGGANQTANKFVVTLNQADASLAASNCTCSDMSTGLPPVDSSSGMDSGTGSSSGVDDGNNSTDSTGGGGDESSTGLNPDDGTGPSQNSATTASAQSVFHALAVLGALKLLSL